MIANESDICYIPHTGASGSAYEHKLVKRLLSNYSYDVRPVADWEQVLDVTFDIILKQIIGVVSITRYQLWNISIWSVQSDDFSILLLRIYQIFVNIINILYI